METRVSQQLSFTDFVDLTGSDSFELVDNARIAALTGLEEARLFKSTQMRQRPILRKEKENIDIAVEVTEKLFDRLGISGEDAEGLALCHTAFSEEDSQALAEELAQRVGITRGKIFGIPYGCTGFVKTVEMAAKQAQELSKGKHVPLVTIETPERHIDTRDRFASPIFAAGAAATSLWKGPGHTLLHAENRDRKDLPKGIGGKVNYVFRVEEADAKDFYGEQTRKNVFRMNGDAAFQNGQALIEESTRISLSKVMTLKQEGRKVFAVPHQPNVRIIRALDQVIGPEIDVKFVEGMEGMGNSISCTIPSVLSRMEKLLGEKGPRAGDIILFPAAGICMKNPETHMSQGEGAMLWNPRK